MSIDVHDFLSGKIKELKLKTIYVGDKYIVDNVTEGDYMFYGCESLEGAIGFQNDKMDVAYANTKNGYFTDIRSKDQQ